MVRFRCVEILCGILLLVVSVFLFYDPAPTDIDTYLHPPSLHDALPISPAPSAMRPCAPRSDPPLVGGNRPLPSRTGHCPCWRWRARGRLSSDRKSTRLNSSH